MLAPAWATPGAALTCGVGRGNLGSGAELRDTVIQIASYLFLAGILLVFASIVPRVRSAWPRGFMVGFLLAVGSVFLVLFAAMALA